MEITVRITGVDKAAFAIPFNKCARFMSTAKVQLAVRRYHFVEAPQVIRNLAGQGNVTGRQGSSCLPSLHYVCERGSAYLLSTQAFQEGPFRIFVYNVLIVLQLPTEV